MSHNRVIPCLLLRNNGFVKSIKFGRSVYIGDPINTIKIFNDKEVDELVLFDIDSSKNGKEPNYDLLSQIVSECFVPLCYGGGVTSLEQAIRLVQLGIEKIAINSAAINDPNLITQLSQALGTQSVVVGIDVKKDWLGRYRVYDASTGKITNLPPEAWAIQSQLAGAGEIFLNNVDRDGTGLGYDLELIGKVKNVISIPLVCCGGAGSPVDFLSAVKAGASAVAAGSLFLLNGKHRAVLINYPSYESLEKLFS